MNEIIPEWYWQKGLHDAEIISVTTVELPVDWRAREKRWNVMTLELNSEQAIFDTSVKEISLFNYKVLEGDISDLRKCKAWWFADKLSFVDGAYLLDVEFTTGKKQNLHYKIKFEDAEIKR